MTAIEEGRAMIRSVPILLVLLAGTACARESVESARTAPAVATPVAQSPAAAPAVASTPPVEAARIDASLPPMIVHKSPTCGCCELWVEHVRAAGFRVEVRHADNLNPIKERLGVPYAKGSCHTAEVGGYVVEGHVPAQDIKRLLAEKPDAKGLVLPGMPLGSPGMEAPDGRTQPYTVELVDRQGATSAFANH